MALQPTFGEYVRQLQRRKGWQLQDLADHTGISMTHLSRLENDNSVPGPDTVVKLATALDGDLDYMLTLADCLPQEILDRLIRRAGDDSPKLLRAAGEEHEDPAFGTALIDEMDPGLRARIAEVFRLRKKDADGIYAVLQELARMTTEQRQATLEFIKAFAPRQRP